MKLGLRERRRESQDIYHAGMIMIALGCFLCSRKILYLTIKVLKDVHNECVILTIYSIYTHLEQKNAQRKKENKELPKN